MTKEESHEHSLLNAKVLTLSKYAETSDRMIETLQRKITLLTEKSKAQQSLIDVQAEIIKGYELVLKRVIANNEKKSEAEPSSADAS